MPRISRAQPKPEPKHPHQHRTPQPGVAGNRQSAHTNTPQRPVQELRGAAETLAQVHTLTPHPPARRGGVKAEHAHKHTHTPTPKPGVAGRSRNTRSNTHIHTAHPSQDWRGAGGANTQTQTHTPQHPSQEWRGAAEIRAPAHTFALSEVEGFLGGFCGCCSPLFLGVGPVLAEVGAVVRPLRW